MNHADFVAEGYYYNGGQELAEPGMVLKHEQDGSEHYYKLVYDEQYDKVYLEQSGSEEPISLGGNESRQLLHDCYPVTEEEQDRLGLSFKD